MAEPRRRSIPTPLRAGRRSRRPRYAPINVLTGICVGAAHALPAAVWATLMPGRGHSMAAAVLAGLFVLIFISRGRALRRQAAGSCAGVSAPRPRRASASSNTCCTSRPRRVTAVLWAALVLAGFGGAGLLAALLVPITRFTPLVRMIAEWLEIVAIIAALPLAAWIGGLFTWVRMR